MSHYKLTALARQDLHEIREHIAADNPAAARKHLEILRQKCQLLASTPGIGAQREEYLGLRKFPVGDYLLFYRAVADGIEVIRIIHAARDVNTILTSTD